MTLGFLDFNSYTFVGGFTVQRGKDLIIPDSLILSQTMLVKWQIRQLVKGATIEQIPPAILSASLEIQGLGVLSTATDEIYPSQQGKDVVQLWTIDPSLPYLLKFSQVSDLVTNSVIEFYTSSLSMATVNNPASNIVDMSPVMAAITASSAAQVSAIQASQAATTRKVASISELTYSANVWSGTPSGHVAVNPDPQRLGIIITNTSNKRVYFDLFTNITNKGSSPQYDTFAEPGATINVDAVEAVLGVMLYLIGGSGPAAVVSISLES
jgi:hypothetical protein